MTAQTAAQVADLIGRVRTDCPAVRIALAACPEGMVVLGVVPGTWKYCHIGTGRKWASILQEYPSAQSAACVAYGHGQGSDTIVIYGGGV